MGVGRNFRADKTIVVNGVTLTNEQATVIIEAINGHKDFGVQYSGYLESIGMDDKEQVDIVDSLYDLLND